MEDEDDDADESEKFIFTSYHVHSEDVNYTMNAKKLKHCVARIYFVNL